MIVCQCRAVSDRDVRFVIRRGARTFAQVRADTGAGSDCGCCRANVEELIDDARLAGCVPPAPEAALPHVALA